MINAAANVTNKEYAVMLATGMSVYNVGIFTFYS